MADAGSDLNNKHGWHIGTRWCICLRGCPGGGGGFGIGFCVGGGGGFSIGFCVGGGGSFGIGFCVGGSLGVRGARGI